MLHNVFEKAVEANQKSVLKEPYKAEIRSKAAGVSIVITAEAEENTDEGRAEADRRAKVVADHFQIVINGT